MQYGCIGEHLTHSYSQEIHRALAPYDYILHEVAPGALDAFMTARPFKAINVTIPYKQAVMPYLTSISEQAAAIGAVNTVVNRDGKLYGYNTDFGGMCSLIRRAGISLAGEKVLILGTGGTSATADAVARHFGAGAVYKVSRSGRDGALTYEAALSDHRDAGILINTTPRGMFSREEGMPIDPLAFPALSGVIDAIYNPLRTPLVLRAMSAGIPAVGGLYMLVMQAVLAMEIFTGADCSPEKAEAVYRHIAAGKENIVLTGMPGSGKTTVGRILAQKLGRPFIDTDAEIKQEAGADIPTIFREKGEPGFRDLETAVLRRLSSVTGAVIATGGGAILRPENVDCLKAGGRLFFLNRPVEQLVPTDDRPLADSADAIKARFCERFAAYLTTADVAIATGDSPQTTAEAVERSFFA